MSDTASDVLLIQNEDYSKSNVIINKVIVFFSAANSNIHACNSQTKENASWTSSGAVSVTGGVAETSAVAIASNVFGGTEQTVITETRYEATFYDADDIYETSAFSSFNFIDVFMTSWYT